MSQAIKMVFEKAHSEPEQWRERGELVELLGHSLFVIDESPKQKAGDQELEQPTILLLHGPIAFGT